MPVAMPSSGRHWRRMCMLMVEVMLMFMFVVHGLVRMGMDVTFGEVKPYSDAH